MSKPKLVSILEWVENRTKAKAKGKSPPFELPALSLEELRDFERFRRCVDCWVDLEWFPADSPFEATRTAALVKPELEPQDDASWARWKKWIEPHEFMMAMKPYRLPAFFEHCRNSARWVDDRYTATGELGGVIDCP